MDRKRAADFDQRLLDLYDKFAHGLIDRRQFLAQSARFAAGGLGAAALLEALSPRYALAAQVDPKDPAIAAAYVDYPSPKGHGTVRGYLVRPAAAQGKLPAVVVVHENRGLNPYIEDVARRLAVAGFLALAPDGLTPLGGYPGSDDQGREMQKQLDPAKLLQDFIAAYRYLDGHGEASGKIGAVGFCYGGGVCNAMAVRLPGLAASVPFYGRQAPVAEVPKIQAPLLIHYAGLDERINAGWPEYEAALKAHGKHYTMHMYPSVNHGFHNDTTPRFDAAAASLAWDRTVTFFKEKLG